MTHPKVKTEGQAAAEAWHRRGPTVEVWLGEATEVMLDMAGVSPGSRVLDVAAGAGGQTIVAARRVGPDGFDCPARDGASTAWGTRALRQRSRCTSTDPG